MLMGSKNKQNKKIGSIKINNKLSNNEKEIANSFNQYFTSIGANLGKSIPSSETDPRSYLQGDFQTSMVVNPVSSIDVKTIINSLKVKGCSIDTFSVAIIKDNSDLIAEPIKILYNQSIATATFPKFLKHAIVTPVYKKNSRTELTNYRPISVLNIFSKIYEKLMKQD